MTDQPHLQAYKAFDAVLALAKHFKQEVSASNFDTGEIHIERGDPSTIWIHVGKTSKQVYTFYPADSASPEPIGSLAFFWHDLPPLKLHSNKYFTKLYADIFNAALSIENSK